MLNHYKTNSTMDRKTLLALNGGAQLTRDFKNGSATMDSICLNITGFIQPAYVVKLLSQDDLDGYNERQLCVCPAERDVDYDELEPFDPTINPVSDICGLQTADYRLQTADYRLQTAYNRPQTVD